MSEQFNRDAVRGTARQASAHVLGLLAAAGVLAIAVFALPAPVVDRMLRNDILAASKNMAERILDEFDAGARVFTNGALSEDDHAFLADLIRSSDVDRVNLMDDEGRIFWSSDPDRIGLLHPGDHVASVMDQAQTHYALVSMAAEEASDLVSILRPPGEASTLMVAEIDHPVLLDGTVVGDLEMYYDITATRSTFIGNLRQLLLGVALVAFALLFGLSMLLLRLAREERRRAEARVHEQHTHLSEQMRLAREVRLLGELNEWLQSSRSLPELFSMVARFMSHILPSLSGSLYVYSNSRDVLDGAVSWNGGTHDDHMRPEDCWGLRRGRTYAFGQSEVDFACAHVHDEEPRRSLCLPILAHGETVGLMTLSAEHGTSAEAFQASRRFAQMSAEQISLAIANVRMRDSLHHQAVRDPLTGLYNRRHLLETLRRLIDGRFPGGVAVVSIDVDHFKRFNDNHGHDAGDMVLRAVGEVLQRHADGDRIACRMGGEELMLLLPGVTDEQALGEAECLRQGVENLSVRYGDKTLPRVTISVGVARHPRDGALPQDLIRAADDALYEAKARGRNQVVAAGHAWERKPEANPVPEPRLAIAAE